LNIVSRHIRKDSASLRLVLLGLAILSGLMPLTVTPKSFSSDFAARSFVLLFGFCGVFNAGMVPLALFSSRDALRQSCIGSWIAGLVLVMIVADWYLETELSASDVHGFMQALFGMVIQVYLWPIYWISKKVYAKFTRPAA